MSEDDWLLLAMACLSIGLMLAVAGIVLAHMPWILSGNCVIIAGFVGIWRSSQEEPRA